MQRCGEAPAEAFRKHPDSNELTRSLCSLTYSCESTQTLGILSQALDTQRLCYWLQVAAIPFLWDRFVKSPQGRSSLYSNFVAEPAGVQPSRAQAVKVLPGVSVSHQQSGESASHDRTDESLQLRLIPTSIAAINRRDVCAIADLSQEAIQHLVLGTVTAILGMEPSLELPLVQAGLDSLGKTLASLMWK